MESMQWEYSVEDLTVCVYFGVGHKDGDQKERTWSLSRGQEDIHNRL